MSAFGNYALESVKALKSAARGLSLWMTKFVLEGWDQQPALMSLHEFLREGGEASFRIMNRLSHLMQNLEFSGLGSAFPFSPASRKNSWRAWDGRTEKKECILCESECACVHVYSQLFVPVCVFAHNIFFIEALARVCRASHPETHIQCFLWASLAPTPSAGLFLCLDVYNILCVSAWLRSLISCFSIQHAHLGSCTDIFP